MGRVVAHHQDVVALAREGVFDAVEGDQVRHAVLVAGTRGLVPLAAVGHPPPVIELTVLGIAERGL